MFPKFVIFAIITGLFAVSIYSSSASLVSAIGFRDINCQIDPGGNSGICCWTTEPMECYNCVKQENGEWQCVKISASAPPPPALRDAIVKAHAGAVGGGFSSGENNTTVKKGEQLKSGSSLKGGY